MKITGIATSASSEERSRTINRRSFVAAVGRRAEGRGPVVASAQTAPASSQPAIPARRASATTSSMVPTTAAASTTSAAAACPGLPCTSAASGALITIAGENLKTGASAAARSPRAAGARITQVPSIQSVASDSAATRRSAVQMIRRRPPGT